jgi:hypothetical protein
LTKDGFASRTEVERQRHASAPHVTSRGAKPHRVPALGARHNHGWHRTAEETTGVGHSELSGERRGSSRSWLGSPESQAETRQRSPSLTPALGHVARTRLQERRFRCAHTYASRQTGAGPSGPTTPSERWAQQGFVGPRRASLAERDGMPCFVGRVLASAGRSPRWRQSSFPPPLRIETRSRARLRTPPRRGTAWRR